MDFFIGNAGQGFKHLYWYLHLGPSTKKYLKHIDILIAWIASLLTHPKYDAQFPKKDIKATS